jgi:hypothetical protein
MEIPISGNNMTNEGGIGLDQQFQDVFEQQRQTLLQYKDRMPKSMRPDEAETRGHFLADTLDQEYKLGKE